jgi:hypothetical protein
MSYTYPTAPFAITGFQIASVSLVKLPDQDSNVGNGHGEVTAQWGNRYEGFPGGANESKIFFISGTVSIHSIITVSYTGLDGFPHTFSGDIDQTDTDQYYIDAGLI